MIRFFQFLRQHNAFTSKPQVPNAKIVTKRRNLMNNITRSYNTRLSYKLLKTEIL